jgi:hypothetical protein
VHNKDKRESIMIVFGGPKPEKNDYKEDKKEYRDNKHEKTKKESKLQYTLEDFGGYTPMSLVSKLEEAKDAIAKGSTKEAIMALDSCIVRITGKQLPENDPDSALKTDPFYELDKILS